MIHTNEKLKAIAEDMNLFSTDTEEFLMLVISNLSDVQHMDIDFDANYRINKLKEILIAMKSDFRNESRIESVNRDFPEDTTGKADLFFNL